jgi:uncharacterized membrane protein
MNGRERGDMKAMMKGCLQRCKWCPLMPVLIGVIAFLLGYFLNAETVRILWLILSGAMVVMGLLCLFLIRTMGSQ